MTDGMGKFIDEVMSGIRCRGNYKKEIEDELASHMELLFSEFSEKGYGREEAEQMAAHAMGSPGDIRDGFQHVIWLKTRKRIVKGAAGLIAVFLLVTGISGAAAHKMEHEKYVVFLAGINEGTVRVADDLIYELYSPDYKNNTLLTEAIEEYNELVDNHHVIHQMVVTQNVIAIGEVVKNEECN